MPFNGAGVFSTYTPGTPYVTGTTISSTVANNVNSDIATGLSTCILKDGQQTATASVPFAQGITVGGVVTITAAGKLTGPATMLSPIKASLGSDVALNNTGNFFDGPSIAQGSSGTWFVAGQITVNDSGGSANIVVKLWDGTNLIASANAAIQGAGARQTITLSGYITSPAGNLRMSAKDVTATTGQILFNVSGLSADSTITAIRIA